MPTGEQYLQSRRKQQKKPKPVSRRQAQAVADELANFTGKVGRKAGGAAGGRPRPTPEPRRKPSEVRDVKSDQDTARGKAYLDREYRDVKPSFRRKLEQRNLAGLPLKEAMNALLREELKNPSRSSVDAAVVNILEETARPIHGVAGAARALTRGENAPRALVRGLQNKDKYLFSDVLKELGAPKAVQTVGGFALDVVADPTTYLTFGSGSVARKVGQSEAKRVARKAARAGMSEAGQRTAARRAAARAEASAPKGSGVTVKFAGKELPGVRRGTAAVGRGAARATPAAVKKAGQGTKEFARNFRPQYAPKGADKAQYEQVRQLERQSRSTVQLTERRAQAQARALQKKIGAANYETVIAALERGKVGGLSPELRQAAVFLRSNFRNAERVRRRAGLKQGSIRNYFPHAQDDYLKAGMGVTDAPVPGYRPGGGGRTLAPPGTAMGRSDRRTLAEKNADPKAPNYSTDVPLVYLNYERETARSVARGELLRNVANMGRPAKVGATVKENEAVFHLGRDNGRLGLREVKDTDIGAKSGKYVILDRASVQHALERADPAAPSTAPGVAFDRATGAWKRVATATPGFHIRNIIGDAQLAYLAQPGAKLPRNVGQAGKALRRVSERERNFSKLLTAETKTSKTIKVAGKRQNLDEFLDGAAKNGVTRTGFIGREIDETIHATRNTGLKRVRSGAGERIGRWFQNREDLFRLATYKHGLDQGMTPRQAADLATSIHIDYGDLSKFERTVARRAAPFYTFTARALPTHVRKLATNPGKYANYEKLREESAKAAGYEDVEQLDKELAEFQQRQAPIVIVVNGKKRVLSAALPLTLLNELPTSANLAEYVDELAQFSAGMLNPFIKTPIELYSNRSFFYRQDIENDDAPLRPAPNWVTGLPTAVKRKLGVTTMIDKRSGKQIPAWRGKTDYAARAIPGLPQLAQNLNTTGTNRRNQGSTEKWIAAASGVRADVPDPVSTAITLLYEEKNKLTKKQRADNQRGVNLNNPTGEYVRRDRELRRIQKKITELSKQRGDVNPLGVKRSAKPKSSSTGPKIDPREREMLLREARQSAAAAPSVSSDREREMLLREARLAAGR